MVFYGERRPIAGWWLWLVAPLSLFIICLATSPVRANMSLVNTALALACVTTVVAILDWRSGVANSIVAALSLNYFHTEPTHSLRITAASDVWMVVLLSALGLGVSASTAFRWRRSLVAERRLSAEQVNSRLLSDAFGVRQADSLWHDSVDALAEGMSLIDVRLTTDADIRLPRIARQSGDDSGLVLVPESGALVEFRNDRLKSRLILTPQRGVGAVEVRREVVFAFVDAYELTI